MVKESFAAGRLSVIGEELLGDEKKKNKNETEFKDLRCMYSFTHTLILLCIFMCWYYSSIVTLYVCA